jgi:hypothetical protein
VSLVVGFDKAGMTYKDSMTLKDLEMVSFLERKLFNKQLP